MEFVVAAYLDADGAGACAEKMMRGFDAARLVKAFEGVGLKIEPATAPFDILLIDQVQKPSLTPSSENAR